MRVGAYDLTVRLEKSGALVATIRRDREQVVASVSPAAFALMPKTVCLSEAVWIVRALGHAIEAETLAEALEAECQRVLEGARE